MKTFNKLVRDKIPEIIKSNNEIPTTRVLDDKEYKEELLRKLLEECNEVINASTKEETLEEIADTLEVLDSLIKLNNSSINEVRKIQDTKRTKRGGFEKRLYLIKTEEK